MKRPPASRATVDGVLETCLYAVNLDDTAEFYETVLGLERISRVEGRHVFFRTGDGVFLLFNPERTLAAGGDIPPHGARGPGHVAFAVDSILEWRTRLESAGVEVETEVTWPEGGQSLYMRDPAGNSVELATRSVWDTPGP